MAELDSNLAILISGSLSEDVMLCCFSSTVERGQTGVEYNFQIQQMH